MNNRKFLKNQVLISRANAYRFWKVKDQSPENLRAYEIEYAIYDRLWRIYQKIYSIELKPRPKKITNYLGVEYVNPQTAI